MDSKRIVIGLGILMVLAGGGGSLSLALGYGLSQGMYFWFYHLAVIAVGVGLVLRERSLIVAFFAAGLVPMAVYFADHFMRFTFGLRFLGFTDFLYHPGLGQASFLLGHAHLLFWPGVAAGLWLLPVQKGDIRRSWIYCGVFHAFIWSFSYFAFPDYQNINCVHGPCSEKLTFYGWVYRLAFVGGIVTLNALFLRLTNTYITPTRALKVKTHTLRAVVAGVGVAVLLTAWDWGQWRQQPKFTCAGPFEDETLKVGCQYTSEWGDKQLMLAYTIHNKADDPRYCHTRIDLNGNEQPLHDQIWAEPKQDTEIWVVVPNPKQNTTARLLATCDEN